MSNVDCPLSPTYRTSVEQKIFSRNAARQFKFGSPKLQDMLRQKCRIRVQEARRASFDGSRNMENTGDNNLVSKILREELAELDSDIELQEHIFKELISEVNSWYVEQLEEEEQYLIGVGDDAVVFCPVCQKSGLQQVSGQQFYCQCGITFNFNGDLSKLSQSLQQRVSQHEVECGQVLNFFLEEGPNDQKLLSAMCESCDYFVSFV